MSEDKEDIDVEPKKIESPKDYKASRKAFSNLALELTDEELKSSGVQKMLLADISRLESSSSSLENYKELYYTAEKARAILLEKQKTFVFSEVLYSVSLTLGAALMGLTPSISSANFEPNIILIIGFILIIGSIVAKVVKK